MNIQPSRQRALALLNAALVPNGCGGLSTGFLLRAATAHCCCSSSTNGERRHAVHNDDGSTNGHSQSTSISKVACSAEAASPHGRLALAASTLNLLNVAAAPCKSARAALPLLLANTGACTAPASPAASLLRSASSSAQSTGPTTGAGVASSAAAAAVAPEAAQLPQAVSTSTQPLASPAQQQEQQQQHSLQAATPVSVQTTLAAPSIGGSRSRCSPLADQRQQALLLEEVRACTDAADLLAFLDEHVPASYTSAIFSAPGDKRIRPPPPPLPDAVVQEALVRLSVLPRLAPPPASEGPEGRSSGAAAAAAVDGQPRHMLTVLFQQLVPLYDKMDLGTRVALLEACGKLTWALSECTRLPSDMKRAAAAAAANTDAPSGGGVYLANSRHRRLTHPAAALVSSVLLEDRGAALFTQPPPEAAASAASSAASAEASWWPVRVLATLGRLRLQEPKPLADLMPPLLAERRLLSAADTARVLVAAVELGPVVHSYIPWSDLYGNLARRLSGGGGGLGTRPEQLSSEELVSLTLALRELSHQGSKFGLALDPKETRSSPVSAGMGVAGGEGLQEAGERLLAAVARQVTARARAGELSGSQIVQLAAAALHLGIRDPWVIKALTHAAHRRLPLLRPDELAQLLHVCAKVGHSDDVLLDAAGYLVTADPLSYNVHTLGIITWAAACMAQRPCPELFSDRVAEAILKGMTSSESSPAATPVMEGEELGVMQNPQQQNQQRGQQQRQREARQQGGQMTRLQPFEVANVAWAFAKQGVRHEGLMRAALRATRDWEEAEQMPWNCLIKVLWAATKLGYGTATADYSNGDGNRSSRSSRGDSSGGSRGSGGGGRGDADALRIAHAVAQVVLKGGSIKLRARELVQAAEGLVPYITPPDGALYDTYEGGLHERLSALAWEQMRELRPDHAVALLSALSSSVPFASSSSSSSSPDMSRLLSRAAARLAPWVSGFSSYSHSRSSYSAELSLAPAQLVSLLGVLRAAGAATSPLLPGLEQRLLWVAGAGADAAVVEAEDEEGEEDGGSKQRQGRGRRQRERDQVQQQGLSGAQALAALGDLGALQRPGAVAELFRLTSSQLLPELPNLPPDATARLLRLLGSARQRLRPAPPPVAADQAPGRGARGGFSRDADSDSDDDEDDDAPRGRLRSRDSSVGRGGGRGKGAAAAEEEAAARTAAAAAEQAAADAVLGSGCRRFLDSAWGCLAEEGRLEQLAPGQLVDVAWGLAACGYDNEEAYDKIAARLCGRVKVLPAWSLARLAVAMHKRPLPAAAATSATSASPLKRYPELAERIAKFGTRELAREGNPLEPEAVAALTEVMAAAAPQYGGFFLAAAHRAQRWLAEAEDKGDGGGGGGGGGTDEEHEGAAARLRAMAGRVRAACEGAGYDVTDMLGRREQGRGLRKEGRGGAGGGRW